MPDTLAGAQARVLALNSDDLPFVYTAAAEGILAHWKYADQKWVMFLGAGSFSADYTLTVTLTEADHEWNFREAVETTSATLGADGLHSEHTRFKGRQKSFHFDAGAALFAKTTNRQGARSGNTYGYTFSTDEVKEPLITALRQAGWQPKHQGLIGRVFGG